MIQILSQSSDNLPSSMRNVHGRRELKGVLPSFLSCCLFPFSHLTQYLTLCYRRITTLAVTWSETCHLHCPTESMGHGPRKDCLDKHVTPTHYIFEVLRKLLFLGITLCGYENSSQFHIYII